MAFVCAVLSAGTLLCSTPRGAVAQEPPKAASGAGWCALPLCREAEGLRRQGDLLGALKLYRYIQAEVDVDEAVVRKPLLWFLIAALHGELQQALPALEALQKYQQYIASRADSELPAGQRREDVDRLLQTLAVARLRIANGTEVEPPPASLNPDLGSDRGAATAKIDPKVAAETARHIDAGLALSKQGLHRSARVEFEQAYGLSHRPELLIRLGQLLLSVNQPREATIYLTRYLQAVPQNPAHAEVEATLRRVRRELALETEARQTAEAQRLARGPQTKTLRRAGIALLSIGGGLLLGGIGLGIGAVATARRLDSGDRYDPTLETTGKGLQNAGISLDVLGGLSLGIGAVCLGITHRREAALPSNLRVVSARADQAH